MENKKRTKEIIVGLTGLLENRIESLEHQAKDGASMDYIITAMGDINRIYNLARNYFLSEDVEKYHEKIRNALKSIR